MKKGLEKILSTVAVETLEKLAFIFAFPDDERDIEQQEPAVVAWVSFSGFFSGTLAIKVSKQVLPEITANMLGVEGEEETTWVQQQDALKETINIICGNLLPAIAGKQRVFNIDTPMIIADGESMLPDDGRSPASIARLALDDGRCDLFLFISDPVPENAIMTDLESE